MNLPKLDLYVNDFSWVVASQIVTKYNNLLSEHKNTSWEQIAVVLLPHRQWNALLDIGVKIFNENGIWEKDTNNGLLLIVANEEKKLRIVTWKWMEVEFSDAYCTQIIETELRPLLNAWNYEGLLQSWYEISTKKRQIVSKNIINELKNKRGKKEVSSQLKKVILLIFIFLVIATINTFLGMNRYMNPSGNSGSSYNSSSSSSSSSYRSSSRSSSSSSSRSSSSFGGGSSNGGGGWD